MCDYKSIKLKKFTVNVELEAELAIGISGHELNCKRCLKYRPALTFTMKFKPNPVRMRDPLNRHIMHHAYHASCQPGVRTI